MKENCIVNYKEGKILKVNSPRGGESKLFNSIAGLPFMESLEQALEAYKSLYSVADAKTDKAYKDLSDIEVNELELNEYKTDIFENEQMYSAFVRELEERGLIKKVC